MSSKKLKRPIYLDYNSTTPVDKRVLDKMLPFFTEKIGNPHSASHVYGWEAEESVEMARENIANLIGSNADEIIFTSGATESNNLALKGAAAFFQQHTDGSKKHIITVGTEHKCVLESVEYLNKCGFRSTILPVNKDGLIDLDELLAAIKDDTFMISVMMVNNEIGTIQNISEIGKICKDNNIWFHTDAAQAFGKIPINVDKMNIDIMSISGHKIYGPKGIGALYIRRHKPRVRLLPLFSGGFQEKGIRSGTIPTPLAVGLGEASLIAKQDMQSDNQRIKEYTDYMVGELQKIDDIIFHGSMSKRIAGNINIGVKGIGSGSLISSLREIAVSSGSACNSSSITPSYVLRAIGVDDELATNSIRMAIGRFTNKQEIDIAINHINDSITALRQNSSMF